MSSTDLWYLDLDLGPLFRQNMSASAHGNVHFDIYRCKLTETQTDESLIKLIIIYITLEKTSDIN